MTHREHILAVLEGKKPKNMPFFPDITDWYVDKRTPAGEARLFEPGQFISDSESFHKNSGTMPERFRDFTLFDFYREFDWGFFVHHYDWYEEEYTGGVEKVVERTGNDRVITFHTPTGDLSSVQSLASNGTWSPKKHFVETLDDLESMSRVVESTRFVPHYERITTVMDEMGWRGIGDTVIFTSPFGKLVHDYMGFEQIVYAIVDSPSAVHDFLALQESKDMELVALAAQSPERLVIISDHPDEYLVSPPYYEQYCIPFYQKAAGILQDAGKIVSTHLDGNFKGYFPLLGRTGFDYLDGCTPAPMFNFEIEELADALPDGMSAFCGVPSTLFCRNMDNEEIFSYAERIITSFKGRGIVNVGDILPPDGNIDQVIALGEYVRSTWC